MINMYYFFLLFTFIFIISNLICYFHFINTVIN